MRSTPILAQRVRSHVAGYKVPLVFKVEGGLHMLASNDKPYFTLTYTQHRKGFPNQYYSGGAGHDEILKLYPQFADMAALHLSDIDGVPMHAEANGWHWLAKAAGIKEQYEPEQSAEECLAIFAKHCRVTIDDAQKMKRRARYDVAKEFAPGIHTPRQRWATIMAEMLPRWKREADACIAKHGLVVYGDPWPSSKS